MGSPGSHLQNWRPGDDDAAELLTQKIADAIRDGKSERQIAKLLNVPRSWIWRVKKLAAIPEGLVERLLDARVGYKALLYIARCFADGDDPPLEPEYCPHCGHLLRTRNLRGINRAIDVVSKWEEDGRPGAAAVSPAADSDLDEGKPPR